MLFDHPRWPQFRAALIAAHLLAVVLKAIPAPEGAMNKRDWANPTVQGELKMWTQTLNGAGLSVTQAELEDQLFVLAKGYMTVRNGVMTPFRPYHRYFGADQNWRLFVAPHMYPSRLSIEVLQPVAGKPVWQQVYYPLSDKDWQAELIENGRMRPALFRYSWKRYRGSYRQFSAFLAERAAADFPSATKMRTRWWTGRSPSPEQVISEKLPTHKWTGTVSHTLAGFRKDEP